MPVKLTVAREVAYDAFTKVMEDKKSPQSAMDAGFAQQHPPLKRLDRNLVREIVTGGLRWYSKIFWIVQNSSSRDLKKTSPQIRTALILGSYQIFYMDRIPDRAAVNESVEYVRKKGQVHAVRFVNGILRSIARRAEYFAKPDKELRPVEYLSLQFAHPEWIVSRWHRRFGFDRLKELLAGNNRTPPWSIRINSLKIPKDQIQNFRARLLRDERNQSERKPLRSCLSLKTAPSFGNDSLFAQGFYSVQDESSQLIANLVSPQPGEVIIDACCGPGGKLSHLYELAKGQAELIGIEKDAGQMAKVKENLARLGHADNITLATEDFCAWRGSSAADKVLIDAPCSGLGVLRRHPEGKWNKLSGLPGKMARIQKSLLSRGMSLLKSGGQLIFSVCSFEEEETVGNLSWLCQEYGDTIEVLNPAERIPDYYGRFVTREKVLMIYSGNRELMDGFGAFILRKK